MHVRFATPEAGPLKKAPVHIAFDQTLAHRISAGEDLVLLPSRSEPSGLNSPVGRMHGAIPLARNTVGLGDTIVAPSNSTLTAGAATGFLFDDDTLLGLGRDPFSTPEIRREDRRSIDRIVRAGMAEEFSSWKSTRRRAAIDATSLHSGGSETPADRRSQTELRSCAVSPSRVGIERLVIRVGSRIPEQNGMG